MLGNSPGGSIYGVNDFVNGVTTVQDGSNKRLQVEAAPAGGVLGSQLPFGTVPINRLIWNPLLNGTSANLLVNGTASSPVVFSYPNSSSTLPGGGIIHRLRLVYSCKSFNFMGNQITSTPVLLGLGGQNATALPNGILLAGTFAGVTTQLGKIQVNEDFAMFNGGMAFYGGDSGRLVITDVIFTQPVIANSSDQLTVTIQDQLANMTTANSFKALAGGTHP